MLWDILTLSDVGLGMGYIKDKWNSSSPHKVLLVMLLNEHHFRRILTKAYLFSFKGYRFVQQNKRKKKSTSIIERCREQIGITYDIGNDFYSAMLGESKLYSCAIWPFKEASLERAQQHKMDVIIEKLDILPTHSILDIGCGWGTLCHYIHDKTQAKVRGIALSKEQINGAKQAYPGLDFEYKDYREERGQYDRIVSVGMLEHVGIKNLPQFLTQLSSLLKPEGKALLHFLGPYDDIFMDKKRSYPTWGSILMPGAESPTVSEFIKILMEYGMFRILHVEDFALHYARTGQAWLKNLQQNRQEILENYSLDIIKAHEFAWYLGMAVMETGYSLVQILLENRSYGDDYDTAVDAISSRVERFTAAK